MAAIFITQKMLLKLKLNNLLGAGRKKEKEEKV